MKATLYKLKEGYVLCSDEEIRGEICLNVAHQQIVKPTDLKWANSNADNLKKVLTQSPDFSELKEEDAKRIGWFDVEKLGYDRAVERMWHPNSMETRRVGNEIIKAVEYGFQKALELTADRRFTEDDLFDFALEYSKYISRCTESRVLTPNSPSEYFDNPFNVKNRVFTRNKLSQPKSWEVEIDENFKVLKIIKP